MNHLTVQKLLREHFKSNNPIYLANIAEKTQFISQLTAQLAYLGDVKIEPHHWQHHPESWRDVASLIINNSNSYHDSFDLRINQENQLIVRWKYHEGKVGQIEEIIALAKATKDILDREFTLASKRNKIQELKTQAIMAQVQKLAQEENFEFTTQYIQWKLRLFVKLSDTESLQIDIPYNRFQEVLTHLTAAIKALRTVHNQEIRFKIVENRHVAGPWIKPKLSQRSL